MVLAILLEIAGTVSMKISDGLTRVVPTVLIFVFYAASFAALTLALKRIEIGVAYAIWSGAGTALIAVIGIVHFREPASLLKFASIFLIVAGVAGLHFASTSR